MTHMHELQPVYDADSVQGWNSLMTQIVDPPSHLRREWICEKSWAVVPVESAKHFEPGDAGRIADAAQRMNGVECAAVATEPLNNQVRCYNVSLSARGLMRFSSVCGSFSYLLVPRGGTWCVLCNHTLYYLVAGPRQFVEDALGCSVEDGRRHFQRFAAEVRNAALNSQLVDVGKELNKEILEVSERYAECNGYS